MFEYVHFAAFGSPFLVAVIVLIWANFPKKNVGEIEDVVEIDEQNELIDRIDKTMRKRSAAMSRKPYAF